MEDKHGRDGEYSQKGKQDEYQTGKHQDWVELLNDLKVQCRVLLYTTSEKYWGQCPLLPSVYGLVKSHRLSHTV